MEITSSSIKMDKLKVPKVEEVSNQERIKKERQTTEEIEKKASEIKGGSKATIDREKLQKEVDGINKVLEANVTSVKFNVHERLDRIYVQVVDKVTDDVVSEIPPEKFLDMVASMLEYVGILIDKKV